MKNNKISFLLSTSKMLVKAQNTKFQEVMCQIANAFKSIFFLKTFAVEPINQRVHLLDSEEILFPHYFPDT